MRIALCLSGSPRAYKEGFKHLKKYVIDPYQPDVFIHFWWDPKSNSQGSLALCSRRWYPQKGLIYKDQKSVDLYDDLKKLYKPKAIAYSKPITQLKISEQVLQTYDKFERHGDFVNYPEEFKEFACRHHKSMFMGQYRCSTVKRKYEKEVGYKYDVIIRTRFDIGFQNMKEHCASVLKGGMGSVCDGLNGTLPSRRMLEEIFLKEEWKRKAGEKGRKGIDGCTTLVVWDNFWIYSNNIYNKIMRQLYFNFERNFKDPKIYMGRHWGVGEDVQRWAFEEANLRYSSLPNEILYNIR